MEAEQEQEQLWWWCHCREAEPFLGIVRRGFPQARAVKGLFSVYNEANTGDSRQTKSFLPWPCSAVEEGRAESTDIPQGSGDKNQKGPRDEWVLGGECK